MCDIFPSLRMPRAEGRDEQISAQKLAASSNVIKRIKQAQLDQCERQALAALHPSLIFLTMSSSHILERDANTNSYSFCVGVFFITRHPQL